MFSVRNIILFILLVLSQEHVKPTTATFLTKSSLNTIMGKSSHRTATQTTSGGSNANHGAKNADPICAISTRIIELENEIDSMRQQYEGSENNLLPENAGQAIFETQFEVESLGNSLAEAMARIEELEQRVQETGGAGPKEDAEIYNSCNIQNYGHKSLLHHLQNINFNIFLRKPINGSAQWPHNNSHKHAYGNDGNPSNYFHTDAVKNPWLYVDLEVPHMIWEITITIRETSRADNMKIYVANDIKFDGSGEPILESLPLFAAQYGNSKGLTLKFRHSSGMCGRHVLVARDVAKEYLQVFEIEGVGYAFE